MNKLGTVLKRIIFAFGIIYGIDVMLKNVGVYLPINVYTVSITSFLGVPGLLSLFAVFYIINQEVIIESSTLEQLIEYYHEKKLAHAYLISTNNIQKCYEVLLKVIKNIFCISEYDENCSKCSLCHLIDIQNLPS